MEYDYLQVSDGSGDAPLMRVQADRSAGASVIDVDMVTKVPAKFIATYGTLGPDGKITKASKRDFRGHLGSGNKLVIDAMMPGSTDNGNIEGQVIVIKPNTHWSNLVATFIRSLLGFGTPQNVTVADVTAEDVSAQSVTTTGDATIGGNIAITGTSRVVPVTTTNGTVVDAGNATVTPNKQSYSATSLDRTTTVAAPTWAAQDMMSGELKLKDNGTARTLVWPANWVPIGLTLPTTTIAGKWMYISYKYSASDNKFHVLGVARQS